MDEAFRFYSGILNKLSSEGLVTKIDSILAVAAGEFDKSVIQSAGFSDVVISNMDVRMTEDAFHPFNWSFQDAEALNYDDASFDFVVVHSGLHHCKVPHQALAEMYRVARKGVLFIESRDSLLMRAAAKAGLLAEYEIEAVVGNDCKFGGLRNSATPNYVYRWTEREVEKIAQSFDPTGPMTFRYFYALRLPVERLRMHKSPIVRVLFWLTVLPTRAAAAMFRKQGNLFGAFIGRPQTSWPWINTDGTIDVEWTQSRLAASPNQQQK